MADEQASSVIFVPDPTPEGTDPALAAWLIEQFRRLTTSTSETATVIVEQGDDQDGIRTDLDAHIQNQSDPHNTLNPWDVDQVTGNLYPDTAPGSDAGLGTLEKAVAHVALGTQEAAGTSGIEGLVVDNEDADGGGVSIIGLRGIDPANPPSPLVENSPVWVFGNPVLLGNQVMLEIGQAITTDHEVLLGPSTTVNGRHYAPMLLGPEKVYSQTEEATDATDYDVLTIGGEVPVIVPALTLANNYIAGATGHFSVYLENLGNQATDFDVIIKVNGVETVRYPRTLVANGGSVSDTLVTANALNIGDVISVDVEATGTGPQSQGWVRGTIQQSVIRIQQG